VASLTFLLALHYSCKALCYSEQGGTQSCNTQPQPLTGESFAPHRCREGSGWGEGSLGQGCDGSGTLLGCEKSFTEGWVPVLSLARFLSS
jgi:hypothetical protein